MESKDEIKVSLMTKRNLGKGKISIPDYKDRVFVLTKEKLSYYEGNLSKRGKLKGEIPLPAVKVIEKVDDGLLPKDNCFQVCYEDSLNLYIMASDTREQEEWVSLMQEACKNNKGLLPMFHCGIWQSGQWSCCRQVDKMAPGCKQAFSQRSPADTQNGSSTAQNQLPDKLKNRRLPPPPVPDHAKRQLPAPPPAAKVVVAVYEYEPSQPGDLQLKKGEEYTITDDSRTHWWKALNREGVQGFIPSNYVQEKTEKGLIGEGWYCKDMSRQRAEALLKQEDREGCFLVRDSTASPGTLTVTVLCKTPQTTVRHYHIKQNPRDSKYFLSEKYTFPTIPELINYHQHNGGGLVTRLRLPPAALTGYAPATLGFSQDKWEISSTELTLMKPLGSGQFGVVRLGKFQGRMLVAVKTMREGSMCEDDFIQEAKTMTKLQHPNLVQLYGVCFKERPIQIVTEYMCNGNLSSYLRTKGRELAEDRSPLIDMCHQVCCGMEYLERNKFIHRDLAARNCLVGEHNIVKVSDFGLSRYVLDDEYTSSTGSKFPIKWASPEVLEFSRFSSKSDIWAFGILMWEVFTLGKTPYPNLNTTDVVRQVTHGKHLDRPQRCPHAVYRIMKQTWEKDPMRRPSFKELQVQIEDIQEKDYCE
ncbi:tyrosine-protein kinase Tec-like [Branchiostoma floridae]|uniref:Tyrosine-protein kinase n=1 Tax=Branchiostoma floridae TaxID=7739 RepID=A0A9J7LG46_BRAFL|nr:tyrosine-protein kinase Tec-like [Branchiostoma floridae]